MTDIQGLRAQLRDNGPRPAVTRVATAGGVGGVLFWAIAVGAAVIGFGIVLLAPRVFTPQRTAALPVYQEAASRTPAADSGQTPERVAAAPSPAPSAQLAPAQLPAPSAPQPAQPLPPAKVTAPVAGAPPAPTSRYAGKTPEEVVRLSDAVCEHRSQAVRDGAPPQRATKQAAGPSGSHKVTAADEKLYCLITEAPARFCAPNQKRRISADIINYFKGIEYTNAAVAMAAKVGAVRQDLTKAEIDPGVVEVIDGLIRAGYLTKANRDEIGANVPRELKDRFARIVPYTPNCPKPPWWASFL
jgi:hypothetical protein